MMRREAGGRRPMTASTGQAVRTATGQGIPQGK